MNLKGRTLGKYELVEWLAKGGMGEVYQAYQPGLDRYVAVKVLHSHLTGNPDFANRFKREATAVARLRHSHILQVFDFDIADDIPYMVMEYIEGPTLQTELRRRVAEGKPITLAETASILKSLASAIDYAHARGIIHRDLKPANIMFTGDGDVVLTDFGIIRILSDAQSTHTEAITGTPAYMSPEQAQGKPADERSDLYSLGIVLYEMVTGQTPFQAESPIAVVIKHIHEPLPFPTNINPDVPLAVEAVLLKALSKNPEERFQRVIELAEAFEQAVGLTTGYMLPPLWTSSEATTALTGIAVNALPCPYRGLFAFREEDADYFFGRELIVEQLITAIQDQPFMAIVGPSGSGKSSVVFAGLLAHLGRQEDWLTATFRPGRDPFEALASALQPYVQTEDKENNLALVLRRNELRLYEVVEQIGRTYHRRFLLVIDQFEEIYTLCSDVTERQRFLDTLLEVVDIQSFRPELGFTLVITLRADFLGPALAHRPLADLLQTSDFKLGPMSRQDLRRAIARPAQNEGVSFEPGLVARILDDVGDEPGNLPLLEFALTSLWQASSAAQLTHDAYESIGGVAGALARYADEVFADLDELAQNSARQIFIQTVQPGEGTEDTRRLATRLELGEANWPLVQSLADARLLVTGRDPTGQETVEVVHEALIRTWPRLQAWMEMDREFRAWQERLRLGLNQWEASRRDDGALLRGVPLAHALGWVNNPNITLGSRESEFIAASQIAAERAERERLAAQQRELEQAQQLAQAQQRRITAVRRALVGITVLLIAAVALAIFGFIQRNNAQVSAQVAEAQATVAVQAQVTAVAERDLAETERNRADVNQATAQAEATRAIIAETEASTAAAVAQSRQLADTSLSLMADNPTLALLLAVEAGRSAETSQAFNAIRPAISAPGLLFRELPYGSDVRLWQQNSSGTRIMTRDLSGNAVSVWDVTEAKELFTLIHDGVVRQASWSHDETKILTVDNSAARVWRGLTGIEALTLTHDGEPVFEAAWNGDDSKILTVGGDGRVKVWDVITGEAILTLTNDEGFRKAVWSRKETQLLTWGRQSVQLWRADTGEEIFSLPLMLAVDDVVAQVAWNPSETAILTISDQGSVQLWDAANGEALFSLQHGNRLCGMLWHPDGSSFITNPCYQDGFPKVWNAETGQELFTVESNSEEWMIAVQWSKSGQFILAIGNSRIYVWNVETGRQIQVITNSSFSTTVKWNEDETHILASSIAGTVKLWHAQTGQELLNLPHNDIVNQADWLGDGERYIVTTSKDGMIRIWDTQATTELISMPHEDFIRQIALSPSDSRILTVDYAGNANLWNAVTGEFIYEIPHRDASQVLWSSDGSRIVTAGQDGTVRVWLRQTGERLLLLRQDEWNNVLEWSQDETLLISGSRNVRTWNSETGEELLRLTHPQNIREVYISPDNQYIITIDVEFVARVWSVATGLLRYTLPHEGHVWSTLWSGDSQYILSRSTDDTAKVWNVTTGEAILSLPHAGDVVYATWNRDESLLLSAGGNVATLWDAYTGEELLAFPHSDSVLFVTWNQDESQILTTGGDNTARIWDTNTGEELFVLPHNRIWRTKWNNDESRIMTYTTDGFVKVWDSKTGEELFSLAGDGTPLVEAAWYPDGRRLLIATQGNSSSGGQIRIYHTEMSDLRAAACSRLGRNLTWAEWQQYIGRSVPYRQTCLNLPVHPTVPQS